jgi:hypothetical protein
VQRLERAGDERGVARAHLLAYWMHMEEARGVAGSEQALLPGARTLPGGADQSRARSRGAGRQARADRGRGLGAIRRGVRSARAWRD